MKRQWWSLLLLCLLLTASPLPATAQKPDTQDTTQQEEKNIVLAGIVTDAETSETLIGANIYYDKGKNKGCVTNASGRFRLAIPKEASAIFVSYIVKTDKLYFFRDAAVFL